MRARPDVDLNSYYILALNKSADISVIDPLLGFGGSKLLTLVMMKSPGEDWVLTKDGEKLFVTLPAINQVAVIDTRSWKVANLHRHRHQADQHHSAARPKICVDWSRGWSAGSERRDGNRYRNTESRGADFHGSRPSRHSR